MRRYLVPLLIGAVAAAVPAAAQEVQRIAAIVNDEVISMFDLEARVRLVIVSTRLQDTPDVRRRIAPQVLRALIDERLQMQEATRRNITVSEQEMERAIATIEKMNSIEPGGFAAFLARNGLRPEALTTQVRATIAWSKLIRRRYQPRIRVGEDEVDEALSRLTANRGQAEYRLAEIVLSVDTPDDEREVRRAALRLVEEIRGGARFAALARQFSRSATAAVGGDLGWLSRGALPDHLKDVVPALSRGQVSQPVRTLSGFQIVWLLDRRQIAGADADKVKVTLRQVFFPLPSGAGRDDDLKKVEAIGRSVSGCDQLTALSQKVGSPRPAELGSFRLSELSPAIREAVADLEIGEASRPVKAEGGLLLLMVCQRDEPRLALPEREAVREQLMTKRIDLISRRVLRDIRLAAVVDIRV